MTTLTWTRLCRRVGHPFFSKEHNVLALFSILYKRTRRSLHSFSFFIKECDFLCVLFRSLQKNAAFFVFFSVLYKRTQRSLRSFPFFIKECGILCVLFGFISHTKIANLAKKM